MHIPDYFVEDGDTLKLYPSKFYLWIWILATSTLLTIFITLPLRTVTAQGEYYIVLLGTIGCAILTIGFAREFWLKQPILILTKKNITTRSIPFYSAKTLDWSEVDDIKLVRRSRNNWIFVYAKATPGRVATTRDRWFNPNNPLGQRIDHLTPDFFPCKTVELYNFIVQYMLERRPEQILQDLDETLDTILQNSKLESLKNPNLVIFDCDGVLVDSEILSYETYVKVFAQENFDISPRDLMSRYSGLSLADMITALEKREKIVLSSDILDKIDKAIREVFVQQLKPVNGVIELLEKLKRANIPVCVVSNGLRGRVETALNATGLKKYFSDDHIFDVSQVKHGKPAPDLLMHAAWALDKKPAHCVVIDDSVTGIAAAQAADMPIIGFLGGSHAITQEYQNQVTRKKPTATAYSMSDVAHLLIAE